jgi:hypothetical protein
LSDEQWNAIAAEFMDLMGLAPTDDPAGVRWVAVRHGLSSGGIDHIHIAATLARQDGTIPSVHNDFLRARQACRTIERAYRLTVTAPADRTAAPRPSRAETDRSARTGTPEPPRSTLRHLAQDAAAAALSEEDFFARLRDAGALIRFRYSDRNPGQVTGYALALPGHTTTTGEPIWFSGGKLAPDLTIPKLRRRWHHDQPGTTPCGTLLSDRSARAFLRSAACSAAARTSDETAYFHALNDARIGIRYRHDDNGAITGYSLRLPGQPGWHGGGHLGTNLTLPGLRRRWATPPGHLKPPVTPAEYTAIWTDVITTAEQAATQMRTQLSTDPAAAADAAWATADLLHTAARAVRGPAGQDLRRAAAEFDRAARNTRIVVPRRSPPGDALRTAARLLSITRPGSPTRKIRALLTILAYLAATTAELRAIQHRRRQEIAATTAHATLVGIGARITDPGADAPHRTDPRPDTRQQSGAVTIADTDRIGLSDRPHPLPGHARSARQRQARTPTGQRRPPGPGP